MLQLSLSRRCALLAATSILGVSVPAVAQVGPTVVDEGHNQIVANNTVTPGPGSAATGANYANSPQVLSTGVTGVGQQIALIQTSSTSASLSLCTGSLINPRTVLTAAHCLYNNPMANYGSVTGAAGGTYGAIASTFGQTNGIPLSFGFSATNRCLGVTVNGCASGTGAYERWRDSGFKTQVALNIYNANQVWYGTGSQPVALGGGGEFANQDIAVVTLDTHARNIPTWSLLFSPMDGPAHVTITGYGGAGVGTSGIGSLAGIDYRRRAAENMVDALMSWHDQNTTDAISGPDSTARIVHQHAVYWMDFDDPNWDPNNLPTNFFRNTSTTRNNGYYDFNMLGGPDGTALPNEGSTAGGDSGGPLIVDQRWDRDVIIGVLTGSISYNGGISTYGQANVYPPLFAFWEQIVQNNPYVYASAKAGDGNWFDPTHWVQDMDPNYFIIGPDGNLVNSLPDTPQVGADGVTAKYGTVCFLNAFCNDIVGTPQSSGDGSNPYITAGGPGSTNFVPNNVEPVNSLTPGATVKARYYDVTLREAGKTTLSGNAQIDKLTIDGAAKLDITAAGNLGVWAEFNQVSGWTNIDGRLKAAESLLLGGILSGTGTFDPTYLTVIGGIIAPGGGDKIGTLTVQGDVILSSASSLFIDAYRGNADKLVVTGDADNAGVLALNGGSVVFNKVTDKAAPRFGEKFTIATAAGGVQGAFGGAYTFQGVLRPELSYDGNNVYAEMRAKSFTTIIDGSNPTVLAFANALDTLRSGSYNNLWNLYGAVDWMNGDQLASTFSALSPRVIGEAAAMQDRQSKQLTATVGDRLSLLANGHAEGLSVVGTPLLALQSRSTGVQTGKLGFGASTSAPTTIANLPGRMTGFMAGGIERGRSGYDSTGLGGHGGYHLAMGLEMPVGDKAVLGTAAGFAEGESTPGSDSNRTRTTMTAAYAAVPLGGGAYVGGMMTAEGIRSSLDRTSTDGVNLLRISGATDASRYSAVVEAGVETRLGGGLTLTPRAQLGYGRFKLDGFQEEGGETALKLEAVKLSRLEGRIGAKLGGSMKLGGVMLTPALSADYVRVFSGRDIDATVRFAMAPDAAIKLPLGSSAAGYAEIKGGVTMDRNHWSLGISGQQLVGGDALSDERVQADFKLRF